MKSARRPIRGNVSGEAAILFLSGAQRFAIAAAAVARIEEMHGLAPVAQVGHPRLGKVRHTLEHDRQPYYVVDSNLLYHMLPSRHGRVMLLHPLKKLKSRIALAVDSIERMLTLSRILPLPCAFSGEERLWYRGLAVVDGNVIPVVDPAAILSEAEMMVLDASMETRLAMAGGAR